MATDLRFERVEDPTGASRVWHFDELSEDAQRYLSSASPDGTPSAPSDHVEDAFDGIDVVKFTDYLRIEQGGSTE